jgi:succinate dehydrogenase hydrophobic anchor subunit
MKENKATVAVALIVLSIFIGSVFYNPWITLKAYTVAATKFGWYIPTFWEMFGLLALLQMLFVHTHVSLYNIWQKVKGDMSSGEIIQSTVQVPLTLTLGWLLVYLSF